LVRVRTVSAGGGAGRAGPHGAAFFPGGAAPDALLPGFQAERQAGGVNPQRRQAAFAALAWASAGPCAVTGKKISGSSSRQAPCDIQREKPAQAFVVVSLGTVPSCPAARGYAAGYRAAQCRPGAGRVVLLAEQPRAQVRQRAGGQPGDVHLGDAGLLADLRLGHVAVEPHGQDLLLMWG